MLFFLGLLSFLLIFVWTCYAEKHKIQVKLKFQVRDTGVFAVVFILPFLRSQSLCIFDKFDFILKNTISYDWLQIFNKPHPLPPFQIPLVCLMCDLRKVFFFRISTPITEPMVVLYLRVYICFYNWFYSVATSTKASQANFQQFFYCFLLIESLQNSLNLLSLKQNLA